MEDTSDNSRVKCRLVGRIVELFRFVCYASSVTEVHDSLLERVKGSLLDHAVSNGGGSLTEATLSKRLKASRGAIRDVLAQLETQGLIERRKKKGTSLRKPSLKEFVDLWDTRSVLEGLAARCACSKIRDADVDYLHGLLVKRAEAAKTGDNSLVDQYDIEFHERIIAIADNSCVRDIVRNMHLFDRIFKYPSESFSVYDESQEYGHQGIVEALRRRDADAAEDLMKRHVQAAKKSRVESLIGKVNLFE